MLPRYWFTLSLLYQAGNLLCVFPTRIILGSRSLTFVENGCWYCIRAIAFLGMFITNVYFVSEKGDNRSLNELVLTVCLLFTIVYVLVYINFSCWEGSKRVGNILKRIYSIECDRWVVWHNNGLVFSGCI